MDQVCFMGSDDTHRCFQLLYRSDDSYKIDYTGMKAFIFDLNGTMVDDMDYHTRGWLHVVNDKLGGCFTYEQVKKEMYGKNSEVLKRLFGEKYFTAFEIEHLSAAKEERYRRDFRPILQLLSGLEEFLQTAKAYGISLAIASAACTANIDFVLDGLGIRPYFDVIVSADDVMRSKPHPETFDRAGALLGHRPSDCLVFEDAPAGVQAASAAGMACIVLTTTHQPPEFRGCTNIKTFWKNYQTKDEDIFND